MKLKFQTLLPHKANTSIRINGKLLQIDPFGCVEVTEEADAAEFRSMPAEWSASVLQVAPRGPAAAVPMAVVIKNAARLVADLDVDSDLAEKLSGMRSPITRKNWLEARGYRFTDEELAAAVADAAAVKEAQAQKLKEAQEKAAAEAPAKPAKGRMKADPTADKTDAVTVPDGPAAKGKKRAAAK